MPAAMACSKNANHVPLRTLVGVAGEMNRFLSEKTKRTINNRPAVVEGQNEGDVSFVVTINDNNSTRHWNMTSTTPECWTLGKWKFRSSLPLHCWCFYQTQAARNKYLQTNVVIGCTRKHEISAFQLYGDGCYQNQVNQSTLHNRRHQSQQSSIIILTYPEIH